MIRRIKFKKIICTILVVALSVTAVSAVVGLFKNDENTIRSTAFVRGSLSEATGSYVEGKTSIVTEELFECKGLKIVPDFDNTSKYQVFWYNSDEIYLGATNIMSPSFKMIDSVPGAAVYARVVIYPDQTDDEGKYIEDFKVYLWQTYKYASSIKIEVAKDQSSLQQNLFKDVITYNAKMGSISTALVNHKNIIFENRCFSSGNTVTEDNIVQSDNHNLVVLDASNVSVYCLDLTKSDIIVSAYFYNADGEVINHLSYTDSEVYYIDVKQATDSACFMVAFDVIDDNAVLSEYLYRNML